VAGNEHHLVRRLWDLDALDQRSDVLRAELEHVAERLEPERSLAEAFTVLAAGLRHLRSEPRLPAALAPSDRADRLRRTYARVERSFQVALADFFARRGVSTDER